ncbi:MAG: helix-turn-helix transcriptional regulator [Actinobacteria bacterium]|nr:helix-turn-helix transcriptional regulator [Actinomycetota bacterium]
MPEMTLEELQAKHPPADQEEYDRAYAAAELAGAVAELVYGIRTEAGFTQTELAKRMGTTQSSIARMESGGSLPTVEMLARLARATGVPIRIEAPGVADVEILAGRSRPRAASWPGRRQPRRRVSADLVRDREHAASGQNRTRA